MENSAGAPAKQTGLSSPTEPCSTVSALTGFDPSRFERQVTFIPAFDRRDPSPSKNYGIGSMRIRFVLKGPLGAVQWMIGTAWDVASARRPVAWRDGTRPDGWDLGYHSPRPLYEGQEPMGSCDILDCECYYDGSGLNADLLIENFLAQGDDYVWAALAAYYRTTFEDADWPFDSDGNLVAQGTEAQRAETATEIGGSVHDGPVPEGNAP
jgi:hypothetical protein